MDNREMLLERALALFAERGYEAVGVQEIVEAAGVTKPTLYHYFGNKLGLLKALVSRYHETFLPELQRAARYDGNLPVTLEQVAGAYFRFAQSCPLYYRLQLALDFAPRQSESHRVMVERHEQQHHLIEELFAAAVQNHGNMRGRQKLYAATFIGMLNTCIGLWLNGYLELDEALTRRVIHQFQHGIYS